MASFNGDVLWCQWKSKFTAVFRKKICGVFISGFRVKHSHRGTRQRSGRMLDTANDPLGIYPRAESAFEWQTR